MSKKYKITEEAVRKAIETYRDRPLVTMEEFQNWHDASFLEKICLTLKDKNPILKLGPNIGFNQMAIDYKEERLGIPSRRAPDKDWVAYWKRHYNDYDNGQRLESEFWEMEMALEDEILGYRIPRE
ncbi:MAG: hypothetical protein KAT77_05305 [Nanoarchaeota archaeon]|nr:hypothetical protein [Nanoarchaeota archaeon]